MRMNMSDFATFFAVARNQSFRAAGDELGLSSSAISHSIKTLEQRLKIRLFNRTTRSVSLTEAGSNLYERLRPAFDEIQIMLDEMNDFRLTPTGTLKINAARETVRHVRRKKHAGSWQTVRRIYCPQHRLIPLPRQ